nr:type III-A CRISPR-associated protein Cas10/Csm1 [uncultured Desulfobulbus sp.]
MDQAILQYLTVGAFLHDLGKFAERAYAVEVGDKDEVQQVYHYAHAYHTELALLSLFPKERLESEAAGLPGLTILNLASRHHNPRSDFEFIVAEADRIASGHDRAIGDAVSQFDTGSREKKSRTPMISVLSRVRLENLKNEPVYDWRYRLKKASVMYSDAFKEIYPVPKDGYTADEVQGDYKEHWRQFSEAIKPGAGFGLDIFDHFPTLVAICREYQWCLAATTRLQDLADTSLFDHQKISAALAACMYIYHADQNHELASDGITRKGIIANRGLKKYLLFCGDISGIQNFIYSISSKGAFRTLKGKSFFIQLLAEIIAQEFIDSLGLTVTNILYASGGKFYLLLPNTNSIKTIISKLADDINRDFFTDYAGNLFIRTGYSELSGDDLTGQGTSLYQAWDDLARSLVFEDRNRYSQLAIDNYEQIFGINLDGARATCPVCSATIQGETNHICRSCREMEEIGRFLPKARYLIVSKDSHAMGSDGYLMRIRDYCIWFSSDKPAKISRKPAMILVLNNGDFSAIPKQFPYPNVVNSMPFTVGSNVSFDRQTFDEIAEQARGVRRLGILRMDVDNLGKIFSQGLEHYKHEQIKESERFHSLGRITTMSWQLSTFFGAVLPNLISSDPDWGQRATVVYSGGDDLFLLGAWDTLPRISLKIVDEFAEFTCRNMSFSLSGGLVLTGGKFPIYKSAQMAGEAEEAAKHNNTTFTGTKNMVGKNSFTFLSTPMHWAEFREIAALQAGLKYILQDKKNHALLSRLRVISASWEDSKNGLRQTMTMPEVEKRLSAEKWRWRMVYSLARFVEGHARLQETINALQVMTLNPVAGTDRQGIALLGVLARWCELEIRNQKTGESYVG